MEPLEVLQAARDAALFFEEAKERLLEAKSLAEGTTATRYDRMSSGNSANYYKGGGLNALDTALDRYATALEQKIETELEAWKLIDLLPEDQGKLVLFSRYCGLRKWADIEKRYNISHCTCHRLHRQSLKELKNIFANIALKSGKADNKK